jgi:hypothetical protein
MEKMHKIIERALAGLGIRSIEMTSILNIPK